LSYNDVIIAAWSFTAEQRDEFMPQNGGEYGGLGARYKIWSSNARATVPF
jgi:hypothetical protein